MLSPEEQRGYVDLGNAAGKLLEIGRHDPHGGLDQSRAVGFAVKWLCISRDLSFGHCIPVEDDRAQDPADQEAFREEAKPPL